VRCLLVLYLEQAGLDEVARLNRQSGLPAEAPFALDGVSAS